MQSAFTNICGQKMVLTYISIVIRCHLCNVSLSKIALSSAVKWKHLGTSGTQPWRWRPKTLQRSADSRAEEIQTSTGINISTKTVQRSFMNGFPWLSSTVPIMGWSAIKHTDTGLWSSGNLFCGGTSRCFSGVGLSTLLVVKENLNASV